MNALVGSVAGLQMRGGSGTPGSDSGSINIRGISSMYADTDPLIIVDGAPYSASLSNIPQSDIESVTVLKDAASAALYGARGASGVIIVTTKRSQARDAVINVDMKWGVNSRAVQDYDVITDPGEYYEAVYAQYYNRYFYGQGMNATTANAQANTDMLKALALSLIHIFGTLDEHAVQRDLPTRVTHLADIVQIGLETGREGHRTLQNLSLIHI